MLQGRGAVGSTVAQIVGVEVGLRAHQNDKAPECHPFARSVGSVIRYSMNPPRGLSRRLYLLRQTKVFEMSPAGVIALSAEARISEKCDSQNYIL